MRDEAWVAALPMYDFAVLTASTDALWSALRGHLTRAGVGEVPARLSRDTGHETVWAHPRLLLGQACEYPLATSPTLKVRLVATPRYSAPGCADATYRSAIVVRRGDPATTLGDLRGRRCVINEWNSNSGMNLLRAAIAPLSRGQRFFGAVQVSGSHRQSIEAIVGGRADVAAIDCVTLAHVMRIDRLVQDAVRVLEWTPASPSLPFITAADTSDATLRDLRTALLALMEDKSMDSLRGPLFLDGFDVEPDAGFATVRELERLAVELGYPRLQ